MQKTDCRIEANALGGAAAVMRQEGGRKRQECIDRIEWGPPAAAVEAEVRIGRMDEIAEHREITMGRFALGAAHRVGGVVHKSDAAQNLLETTDRGLHGGAAI